MSTRARILQALKGVADPELKRKTIGKNVLAVFEAEAKKIGQGRVTRASTLYTE